MLRNLRRKSVRPKDPALLIRQLASMLPAGVPITRCFDLLEKTQPTTSLRNALFKIKQLLLAGHTLHDSLSTAPDWFDLFTRQLIHLGEKTGKLDQILLSLADYHEKKSAFQRKIKQALFYPCIILCTAVMMTLSMLVFVIPSFESLFHDIKPALPLLTRLIFACSSLLNQSMPFILLSLLILTIVTWLAYRQGKLSPLIFRILIKLPRIHNGLLTLGLIRFTRNLGIALAAGIPILEALNLTAGLCGYPPLASAIRKLRAAVSTGVTIHQAMEAHSVFPALIQQMTKVGEESGTIDTLLSKSADLLETELDAEVTTFIQLLEPLIMTVLGVLIGGLVIGMYLPVFNLGSTL